MNKIWHQQWELIIKIYILKKRVNKRKERKKDEDEEAKPTRHIGLILLHKAYSYSTVDEFDSLLLSLPGR